VPLNKNYYICYDFETDGLPDSNGFDNVNAIQLSSTIIDPLTLDIVPDSEFNCYIKPDEADSDGYYERHKSTIDWHCRNKEINIDEMLKIVNEGVPEKIAWSNFVEYLSKYHAKGKRKDKWTAPIPTGENNIAFDNEIIKKYCKKYGNLDARGDVKIMCMNKTIDMKQIYLLFFQHLDNPPNSLSADNVYDWLGIDTSARHDSLVDIRQLSQVFIRFAKYFSKVASGSNFQGSFTPQS